MQRIRAGRRFVKALAAMLLVGCSLSYGDGASSIEAEEEGAAAAAIAAEVAAAAAEAAAGAVAVTTSVGVDEGMVPRESPESLLDQGTALPKKGDSNAAAAVAATTSVGVDEGTVPAESPESLLDQGIALPKKGDLDAAAAVAATASVGVDEGMDPGVDEGMVPGVDEGMVPGVDEGMVPAESPELPLDQGTELPKKGDSNAAAAAVAATTYVGVDEGMVPEENPESLLDQGTELPKNGDSNAAAAAVAATISVGVDEGMIPAESPEILFDQGGELPKKEDSNAAEAVAVTTSSVGVDEGMVPEESPESLLEQETELPKKGDSNAAAAAVAATTYVGVDEGMIPGVDEGMIPGVDGGMIPGVDEGMVPKERPEVLLEQGIALLKKGESKEAVGVLDAAITLWEDKFGSNLRDAAAGTTVHNLGVALALESEDDRAVEVFTRAVRIHEGLFGRDDLRAIESLTALGLALLRQGQVQDASMALARALKARTFRIADGGTTENVSRNIGGLVEALSLLPPKERDGEGEGGGDLDGALLAVDEINVLAWRYFVQHQAWQGQAVLQQALALIEDDRAGPRPPSPARDLVVSAFRFNLGFLNLAVLGDYESAAGLFKSAYELRAELLGVEHALTVQTVVSRGWALMLLGKTSRAALELSRSAESLMAVGQAAAAERLLRQALQGAYDPLGPTTYAHACITQHVNLLRGQGSEGIAKGHDFSQNMHTIALRAELSYRHSSMSRSRKLLVTALMDQIEDTTDEGKLMALSDADKDQLRDEIATLRRRYPSKGKL